MIKEDILNPLKTTRLLGMDDYFDDLLKLYNSENPPKVPSESYASSDQITISSYLQVGRLGVVPSSFSG